VRCLGVVVGAIVWLAGFYLLVAVLAAAWPAYLEHGRVWQAEMRFTFTTPMAWCNLLFWLLADIGAGWTATRIARRREALWVLAGLVEIYVVAVHIVLFWPGFPWWYNLGVVLPLIPAMLLGGRLARGQR